MYNGIINVYKEKGYTSFDVVAKLRGILKQKKIGHTGTLDPDAEGVLPVCIGQATKLCEMYTDKIKEYETVMLLGKAYDTQDVTGQIISTCEESVLDSLTHERIEETIMSYVGEISQVPPMYSALKVNGQKLCDLARRGIEVPREPRKITIHDIHIIDISIPRVTMRVKCSKGTYIRTLCDDIGRSIGCFASMEKLLRTKSGAFELSDSIKIGDIEDAVKSGMIDKYIIPIDEALAIYDEVQVNEATDRYVHNGNAFRMEDVKISDNGLICNGIYRVYDSSNVFIGLYEKKEDIFTNYRMFYSQDENNR